MTTDRVRLATDMEILRRAGTVSARCASEHEASEWRAAIRKWCRSAGLRVRTGLVNGDTRTAWAFHLDHVVTEADQRAANRLIEAALSVTVQEPASFHELVRQEQRKMLRVVRSTDD